MNFNKVGTRRTICEVVREIHDIIDQNDPVIVSKLEEITHMAKRMVAKLVEYKRDWSEDFFEANTDTELKHKIRKKGE